MVEFFVEVDDIGEGEVGYVCWWWCFERKGVFGFFMERLLIVDGHQLCHKTRSQDLWIDDSTFFELFELIWKGSDLTRSCRWPRGFWISRGTVRIGWILFRIGWILKVKLCKLGIVGFSILGFVDLFVHGIECCVFCEGLWRFDLKIDLFEMIWFGGRCWLNCFNGPTT